MVTVVSALPFGQSAAAADLSSADIRPLEARIYPIEGISRDIVADVSALGQRAIDLAEGSAFVTATATGEGMRLSVEGDVLFGFDSDAVSPEAEGVLQELGDLLAQTQLDAVVVEGHTDSIGSNTYNLDLSERRAASVVNWLRQHADLTEISFETVGYGSSRSVAPNTNPDGSDNPEGRARNRRVEFLFVEEGF